MRCLVGVIGSAPALRLAHSGDNEPRYIWPTILITGKSRGS